MVPGLIIPGCRINLGTRPTPRVIQSESCPRRENGFPDRGIRDRGSRNNLKLRGEVDYTTAIALRSPVGDTFPGAPGLRGSGGSSYVVLIKPGSVWERGSEWMPVNKQPREPDRREDNGASRVFRTRRGIIKGENRFIFGTEKGVFPCCRKNTHQHISRLWYIPNTVSSALSESHVRAEVNRPPDLP